jgi:hypothetical protein
MAAPVVFTFTSSSAAKLHTITHNLNNSYPNVAVWDVEPSTTNYKQLITESVRVTSTSANVVTVALAVAANVVVQIHG